jgi:hypothetical protein
MKIGQRVLINQVTEFIYTDNIEKGRTVTKKVMAKKPLNNLTLAMVTGFTNKSTGIYHNGYNGTFGDGDSEAPYLEVTGTQMAILVRTSLFGKEKTIQPDDVVKWLPMNEEGFELKKRRDTKVDL